MADIVEKQVSKKDLSAEAWSSLTSIAYVGITLFYVLVVPHLHTSTEPDGWRLPFYAAMVNVPYLAFQFLLILLTARGQSTGMSVLDVFVALASTVALCIVIALNIAGVVHLTSFQLMVLGSNTMTVAFEALLTLAAYLVIAKRTIGFGA